MYLALVQNCVKFCDIDECVNVEKCRCVGFYLLFDT